MPSVPCHFCARPVHIDFDGSWQLVTGWVPKRSQGGANAIKCSEPSGKWAHAVCIDREARGLTNQASLDV